MSHKKHIPFFPVQLWKTQGRGFWLFHSLLFLLILYPYLENKGEPDRPHLLILMNTAVIVAILHTVRKHLRQFIFGLVLATIALSMAWFAQHVALHLLGLISYAALYIFTILHILAHLLYSEETNTEEIYGATSVYILLGLTWATLYEIIHLLYPGSFDISPIQNLDNLINWSDFLYYSFTTLTTLGYGEIVPVTSQARSLAILESITGVIFIAVMVARVIGMSIVQQMKSK